MNSQPKVAILRTDGTNCDEELAMAFRMAGGEPEMVHVNELLSDKKALEDYQMLALPGGFSYGDDVLSGKVLANELINRLSDQIYNFIEDDKLVLGICNGFQVLVRAGLLPWQMGPAEDVSLVYNDSGSFECRWVRLKVTESKCVFTRGLAGEVFDMPVAHGEGKLVVEDEAVGERLAEEELVVVQYADDKGKITGKYPDNPNGSYAAIAGICNTSGRIFGLMPHPERNTLRHHHPDWQRPGAKLTNCLRFFENAVGYFK